MFKYLMIDKELVTYSELNKRANKLAHTLIQIGVQPDNVVPVCIEKSIHMVVAILAVLKAGAAYVPLDPEYPKDRIHFIIRDTNASVCITTSNLQRMFAEGQTLRSLTVDEFDFCGDERSELNPVIPGLKSSNLCYLIFTSGSTGKPKGVMLEHRCVVNYVAAHQKILDLSQDDRFLQFANYTFDASILDLFVNLTTGSRLCLASKNNLLTDLPGMMNLMKVTAAQLTTTVASLVDPSSVPTLKLLQQGGEMLTKSVRDAWASKVKLHNGYGPTETAVYTIIKQSLKPSTSCANIGWPIGRSKVLILNDRLELIPLGAVGELCIGGPQLARGYLNRPDLTEKSFVSSPFNHGERLYRTGDLGRFNPDGSITILGRKDNQVKLNGLRIEIEEIEHVLNQSPEVSRVSVRLLNRKSKTSKVSKVLVAFVTFVNKMSDEESVSVLELTSCPEVGQVQESVRKQLPPYMVPTVWVPLTKMPINTSGKTDLKTLELLYTSLETAQDVKEAKDMPTSAMEVLLQEAWGEVLNVEKSSIGTGDSFYHLGGDSISAIQISAQCRQNGVEVSVQSILQHPTIRQLANYARFTTLALEKQSIEEDEEEDWSDIPFTPIQHQFFGVTQPEVNHFHLSWLVSVRHPIELPALRGALFELIGHHDMLRTRFTQELGRWRQWLASNEQTNFEVQRHRVSGVEELKSSVLKTQRSLNVETGPVSSFVIYDLPSGEQLLFMTIHHYIIDLVSWRIFWEDLEKLLSGQSLSYKTLSFRKWSKLLQKHAESLTSEDWPQQALIEPLDIDMSKLSLNTMETVETLSFTLDSEYTALMFGRSNDAYGTEAVDFMLATLATSYCDVFQTDSITFATEGHGREPWDDSIDVSRTIGWFTSIYPVTIQRKRGDSLIDVLKQTKDTRRAIPNHGLDYGLLRYLNSELSSRYSSDRFQVGFNYFGRFQHLEKGRSLFQQAAEQYTFDLNMIGPKWRRMNAIEVEVTVQRDNLSASISYSNQLHHEKQISQWLQAWKRDLMEAVQISGNKKKRELTVSDIPLLCLNAHQLHGLLEEVAAKCGEEFVQNIEDMYPCCAMQEGLIVGNARSASSYHVQDVYTLPDGVDEEQLLSAWRSTVNDLPILRTVFIENSYSSPTLGAYLQVVLRHVDVDFQRIYPESQDIEDAALNKYLEADGEKNRMIISRHHAINDGWSDKITMAYLEAVFNSTSRPAVIPYKEYISYCVKQNGSLSNEEGAEYWSTYLAGIDASIFPKLGETNARAGHHQVVFRSQIPMQVLKDFSKKAGVTTLTLLQAAWGMILQPYYGKEDFVYGVLTNGRNISMKQINHVEKFEDIALVLIDSEISVFSTYPFDNLRSREVTEKNLCYILYTSGSTGTPKGVMLEHSSVVSFIHSIHQRYQLTAEDSILQFANYTFDASVFEIYAPLAIGASVVMARKDYLLTNLEDWVNRLRATFLMLTPTIATMVDPLKVPSVKHLMFIGEMLTTTARNIWSPHVEISNGYGPTESTVLMTVNTRMDSATSCSNVGLPVGNNRIYILGADRQPVPLGVVGELCVAGPQLARGYLNRPDLTGKAFVPGPFVSEERLYCSGDLARFNADGSVELIGRIDNQVKIHGLRIELDEIEHALHEYPRVARACEILEHCHHVGEKALFDSLLVVQNIPQKSEDEGLATIGLHKSIASMPIDYPIVMEINITGTIHSVDLTYDEQAVTTFEATWIMKHFVEAIKVILHNLNSTVKSVRLLTWEETSIMQNWNLIEQIQNKLCCIHELFEQQALLHPDNWALQFEDEVSVSYSDLNRRANQLAHHLIKLGVRPESMVPLCLDKSVEMVVAMLAVLKAGGAYVPLDPNNPVERNRFILAETNAQVVVTLDVYRSTFDTATVVLLDSDLDRIRTNPEDNPEVTGLSSSNLCYVLFTSGSTGTPKGVMLEHAAVVSFIHAIQQEYDFSPKDSILQFANYTFDASVFEIYVPLAIGASVAMARKDYLLTDLEECIRELRATFLMLTPTIATLIDPLEVPSVRNLMFIGEMLTTTALNKWSPYVDLSNGYGPTESAVLTTVNTHMSSTTSCSNVGKPIGNNRLYVLGDDNYPVPFGVVGELCVAGSQLARGYLNRPDLTDSAFITSPFVSAERLYKTGDLARFNSDGSVELVGRKDNQIKIHGLRIELDEIEHALHQHSKVARACIVPLVTDKATDHKSLVAFVTFNDLTDSNSPVGLIEESNDQKVVEYFKEIKSLVRNKLPTYMMPSTWVPVSRMPTTTSQKTDRKSLAALYASVDKEDLMKWNHSDASGHVGARTTMEESWAELWSAVLKISPDTIGSHDSFFSLGGDSILAIRLVGAAHKAGFTLTVQDLYLHPTIAELASTCLPLGPEIMDTRPVEKYSLLNLDLEQLGYLMEHELPQHDIMPDDVVDIYPCSPMQEALVALSLQDSSSYVSQLVYKCEGNVDLERLRAAWHSVIEANPILRTAILFTTSGFAHLNGLQVVLRSKSIEWDVQEYEDATSLENSLARALEADRSKGVSVGQPLTRFALLKTAGPNAYLVWTIHHALYDGWSMNHIVSDVVAAYQGHDLPARPPYSMYINYLLDTDKSQAIKYWQETLGSATPTHLARSSPTAAETQLPSTIVENIQADFRSLASEHNLTVATIAYLAWALVLKCHTGNPDVVFGVVDSGRSVPLQHVQDICGPCITTLPMRINLSDTQSLLDALKLIQSSLTHQKLYQSIGLQDILKQIGMAAESSLFDTLLVVQNINLDNDATDLTSIGLQQSATSMPIDYPALIEISLKGSNLQASLTYQTQIFTEFEATWIAKHFVEAMRLILRDSSALVKDVSIRTEEEIISIKRWSTAGSVKNSSEFIHELIEQQALLRPEQVAIQFEETEYVTYGELNCRANQLAHHLIKLGVRPESMVPLCLDKSVEMVVAMLAVLKAGGAYVPLDPNNPVERNKYILNEISAQIVLTSDQHKSAFEKQVLVLVDRDEQMIGHYLTSNPEINGLSSSSLCYVLFTSGSTGMPKGVVLEHSSVVSFIHSIHQRYQLTAEDSILQFANYTFDASVFEIYAPLAIGASVVMARKDYLLTNLEDWVNRLRATFLMLTPTIATMVDPLKVPSVKHLMFIGEMLTTTARNIWSPHVEISNGYGPTESTVLMTVNTRMDSATSCSNVGLPVGNNRIYILGADRQPVPLGVVGELCVAGPQLARGYLNRPDLTGKAFVPGPFVSEERLYCSGDLARFNADGSVELIGRIDNQVKIHGLRVELDEIEHVLNQHAQVARACVIPLVTDPNTNRKSIVAFLTFCGMEGSLADLSLLTNPELSFVRPFLEEVKEIARRQLPSYMVPNLWLPLNAIPINTSDKTDRRKLEGLFKSFNLEEIVNGSNNESHHESQQITPLEKQIQKIWSDTLNIPVSSISIEDTFYQLGGDSISAIRVSSLSRQNGLSLSVKQIMQNPTIRSLASVAAALDPSKIISLPSTSGDLILTPIQRRFLYTPQENMNHFNQSWLLKLRDTTTKDRLSQAVNALMSHHDLLRSRLSCTDGAWKMRIVSAEEAPFQVHQMQVRSIDDMKGHIHQLQRSLDLMSGPMFQFALYELEDRSQLLFMTVHHLIVDLVSWRIIWEDLEQLLQGKQCGYKSMSFMQWSAMLNEYAQELGMDMWPSQEISEPIVRDAALLDANRMSSSKSLAFTLSVGQTELLFGKCNLPFQTEATDLMISSLAIAYCKVFNAGSMTIGMEGHGRETWRDGIDVSRTVGWFTTLYPLVVEISEDLDQLSVLKRVKDQRKLMPGNGLVYGLLRYMSNNPENRFKDDVIQIGFNYLGRFQQLESKNAFFQPVDATYDFDQLHIGNEWRRDHVFDVTITVEHDCLKAEIVFNTSLHTEEIVSEWLFKWDEALGNMIESCAQIDTIEHTRSDFSLVKFNEAEFNLFYTQTLPGVGVDPKFVEDILPCTPLQEGLIAGMFKNANYYHIQQQLDLVGEFDPIKFQSTWETMIRDHPILRTIFVESTISGTHNNFLQLVMKYRKPCWSYKKCAHNSLEKTVATLLAEDKSFTFDLGLPTMRFTLLETDQNYRMLFLSWHHAILDATAWDLILQDYYNVYNSQSRVATYPFAKFVEDLYSKSEVDIAKEKSYWQGKFSQASRSPFPTLGAPEDPAPEMRRVEGRIHIPMEKIAHYAQQLRITTLTLVKAAWASILREYTQNDDVIFGYVVHGRSGDLEGISTIVEWLMQIHVDYTSALSYQQTSLREIQEWVGASPLFDSILNYRFNSESGTDVNVESEGALRLVPISGNEATEYPLALNVYANSSEIMYQLDVVGSRITRHYARQLASGFEMLFEALVSLPSDKEFQYLNQALNYEDSLQLCSAEYTGSAEPLDTCIHHLFEEKANLYPNQVAARVLDLESVTYVELNTKANQLAHYLIKLGVLPDSIVPLCLDKSISMIVAILAVLKAGGAYVPLDPDNPMERNRFILKETKAKVVLTLAKYKQLFDEQTLVLLDSNDSAIGENDIQNPQVIGLDSSSLCYVIYTSGSTGTPKGVMMEHRGVCSFIRAILEAWDLSTLDSVLQFANYTFDASVMEIFCTLASGACLALATKERLLSDLEGCINTMNVTTLVLTTTIAALLEPVRVPSVKRLMLGGEMMTATVRNLWSPHVQLSNGYGPTEAAVAILSYWDVDETTACSNIGKPIGGNKISILGANLQPVPLGVVGELCVSGPQLARGYLNRPDLTEKAFVTSCSEPDIRIYRTGDLALFNEDGTVKIVGRIDNQIKINGLRIELDEIEHALHDHPRVARACVMALTTDKKTNRKSLVAFLAFYDVGSEATGSELLTGLHAESASEYVEELRAVVSQRLPSYMIPNIWLPLNMIPTNTSGKVDRRKLADIFATLNIDEIMRLSRNAGVRSDEAVTLLEGTIRGIWAEVLNIPAGDISVGDTFYQLGGDSISAIRVSSLSRQNGLSLSVKQIMQNPTIRSLASVAAALDPSKIISLPSTSGDLILTPIQRRFLYTPQENMNHFNQSWLLKLRDTTTKDRLSQAVNALMSHHDLLRSRLSCTDGAWKMRIVSAEEAPFQVHQMQVRSIDDMKGHIHQLQRSLDLMSGPMFQFALYELEDRSQLLFMTVHHLIVDLVSWRIIWEDLEQLLQGKQCGYKSMSFMQWSAMLNEYAQELGMDMWPSQEISEPIVRDAALLDANRMSSSKSLAFTLSVGQTELLFGKCNLPFQTEATDLMISSLAIAYCKVFNAGSMTIGMEGHGRETWRDGIDVSRTVGWFTTLYPLVVEISEDLDQLSVLKRVKDQRKLMPGNGLVYGLLRYMSNNPENRFKDDVIQIGSDFRIVKLSESEFDRLYNLHLPNLGVERSCIEDILPCTPLQEGLIAGMFKNANYYHIQQQLDLVGEFDPIKFQSTWETMIRDHPILRTIFVEFSTSSSRFNFLQIVETVEKYLADDKANPFRWHHAIIDATTFDLVLNDFCHVYNQKSRVTTFPFAKFVEELCSKSSQEIDAEKPYWQNKLSDLSVSPFPNLGAPEEHALALCRVEGYIEIPINKISHITRQLKVTPFTLIKAAWAILLREYTRSDDVVFGYVVNGRNGELEGVSTIVAWLREIHQNYTAELSLQQNSLRDIQEWVGVSPLFDTIVNYRAVNTSCVNAADIGDGMNDAENLFRLEPKVGNERTEYSLVLNIVSNADELIFSIDANSYLTSRPFARQIANDFKTLLCTLMNLIPGSHISDMSMALSKTQVPVMRSTTSHSYPAMTGKCVHQLIEEQAKVNPQHTAIQFELCESVSYEELNCRANQLAHHLIKLGVRPESMVPLCLDKSVEMVVAMLAVLKAGGAYVPLDPENPVERNRFILAETNAQVVVTLDVYRSTFDTATVVLLDSDLDRIRTNPEDNPEVTGLSSSNLCYVLFTSGSTGTPKGVMLEHAAVVSFIHAIQQEYDFSPKDSILQFANYTFDASVFEIYVPLAIGASVAMARKDYLLTDLEECIRELRATFLMLTPTIATLIDPLEVPSVRNLMFIGEMLTTTALNKWSPYVDLSNGYGPTESAVLTTVNTHMSSTTSCSNVGKPIGNNRLYVLGDDNYPVPFGVVGELCVAGSQLARGYLNRPDLTDSAFITSPFVSAERLYKTGDLARFNSDGSVELVGRKDNQIKIHGLRIELDEIEHALHQHSKVARACIVPLVTDKATDHKSLVAFVTFNDLTDSNSPVGLIEESNDQKVVEYFKEIKSLVRNKLPTYMMPSTWVPVSRMPTTTSQKTDRKSLAALFASVDKEDLMKWNHSDASGHVGARTAMEESWAELWSAVLKISPDTIGSHDSFFSLGGDSILAIRLVGVAHKAGFTLTVHDLYLHPTIAELASTCLPLGPEIMDTKPVEKYSLLNLDLEQLGYLMEHELPQHDIMPDDVVDIYPCSPMQEALVALSLQDSSSYVSQLVYKCEGNVDLERLRAAWHSVIEANPILRTAILFTTSGFAHLNGLQVVLRSKSIEWDVQEYEDATSLENSLARALEADRSKGVSVGQPLTRFALLKTAGPNAYLVWTIHHALYDGWSMNHIVSDVVAAYQGHDLPARPPYSMYINYLLDTDKSQAIKYWQETLGSATPTHLARSSPTAAETQLPSTIVENIQADFRSLASEHNLTVATIASLFDTLLVVQNINRGEEEGGLASIGLKQSEASMPIDYPLVMEVSTSGAEHSVALTYDTRMLTGFEASYIVKHFVEAMKMIVTSTHNNVKDARITTPAEAALMESWSAMNTTVLPTRCIHELVEQRVLHHPEQIAIQFENTQSVTYGELNCRANQLAHHLISLGVRPGSIVPLCLDKSVVMIVAILAVLKAGGAYVPLDPDNPMERNRFILKETKAKVVLTLAKYKQLFDEQTLVLLDSNDSAIGENDIQNPQVIGLDSSSLCYVIYTSGSTGTPKGVMMEHRGVCSFIRAILGAWDLSTLDSVLQFANYTFDASVMEIFCTLASGACLALATKERLLSDLEGCINTMNVTTLVLTTTIAALLEPVRVPSVKRLMLGGEMMTATVRNLWSPHVQLSNGYGPTEAAVAILSYWDVDERTACSNIGKPIGGNKTSILGANLQPVPLGVVGELCVSGPQLARGYLNRPDLTEKAFVTSCSEPDIRIYRTGDLALFNEDGTVKIVGRIDNQIKINGLRIELDEIEHALHDHPRVARACVMALTTDKKTNRKSLVAFLAFYDVGSEATGSELLTGLHAESASEYVEELRAVVSQRLPSYMIPNIWLPLNMIPNNTSGKVDHRKLADIFAAFSMNDISMTIKGGIEAVTHSDSIHGKISNDLHDIMQPRNSMQFFIQEVWSKVLKIPRASIRIDHTFRALGGDSILAIHVSSECRKHNIQISVHSMLKNHTIIQLAENAKVKVSGNQMENSLSHGEVHLSANQRMFLEFEQENYNHFNQSWLFRTQNPTNKASLQSAVGYLILNHDILRSRFSRAQNEWKLRILSPKEMSFEVHRMQVQSRDELKASVHHLQRSLDLISGPLFQFALYDLQDGQQLIFMAVHHFIIDLMSWGPIWEELGLLLQGEQPRTQSVSYMQWNKLLYDHAQTLGMRSWPTQPLDQPIITDSALLAKNTVGTVRSISFKLDPYFTKLAESCCGPSTNMEMTDLLTASLAYSYCCTFERESLSVTLETHGRQFGDEDVDISRTVGWFTNLYPIVVHLGKNQRIDDAIRQTIQQHREIRGNEANYGLLRYINQSTAPFFAKEPPQVTLGYLPNTAARGNPSSYLLPIPTDSEYKFDLGGIPSTWKRHQSEVQTWLDLWETELIYAIKSISKELLGQYMNCTLYSISDPTLGTNESFDSVETIASRYLKAILQVQPVGPYYLHGYSFGGLVAFEMARQLEWRGHEVSRLTIIDTLAPHTGRQLWASANQSSALEYLTMISSSGEWSLDEAASQMMLEKIEQNTQLMRRYDPSIKKLTTDIVLVKGLDAKGRLDEQQPCYGWSEYSSNVSVHSVDAEHHKLMFEPHVARVAEVVSFDKLGI
ncbi:hypothetical protein K493DRAFT_351909 [Basidiobolus meristosporus CBS 931.73]|uniref:Carrier domain-containing protein n=1 Tax=Basidiobolus meristosporus CBS 931.73 TaxID=1314790 RepID=A0A1Y1YAL1_9FUNG|nr:hypothetical protein K493DRAFT_351909 [Basidiobolus meristosporus CBS 931.73]|eukprot:ORX95071.1 hypothetical protein K493DRAFT_351909 [Basidiobolus meristosporus CBS 931.73]